MTIKRRTKIEGITLNDLETRRINRQIERLENRLEEWPEPIVTLLLEARPGRPGASAQIRVRLGHLGGHLGGRESADSADKAVQAALDQINRQLERRRATRRGQHTFGVPSRRSTGPRSPIVETTEEQPSAE